VLRRMGLGGGDSERVPVRHSMSGHWRTGHMGIASRASKD
jgi:hypothetical protein